MPNYNFVCRICDKQQELNLGYDDDVFPKCEDCNVTLSKVFTPPAIHFKGGGWGGNHGGQ
jgi:hypothetical protein